MKILQFYSNRSFYMSPEDEVSIYHEVPKLLDAWRNIILPHSTEKICDLPKDKLNFVAQLCLNTGTSVNPKKDVCSKLDRVFIEIILWGATLTKNKPVIDNVFMRTRNNFHKYFHHDLIIEAYLNLEDQVAALGVLSYIFNKGHSSCMYIILNYKDQKYVQYDDFKTGLLEFKRKANLELLAVGEKVDLYGVSIPDIIRILEEVKPKVR